MYIPVVKCMYILLLVSMYIFLSMTGDVINRAMKLKKHLNRKDKDTGKEFFRYDITIDPGIVQELGWKAGDELKSETKGKELKIKKI